MLPTMTIAGRRIGANEPPLVVAEVGINHEGSVDKACQMIDAAASVGCECVKFQCHIIDDEMIPNCVIPGNATESIWEIMARCSLTEVEERLLKQRCEAQGMIFLSTPFSRAAADRLEAMGVAAYKIGSGECNNYPLIEHIASFQKPIILSTGMNDLVSIQPAIDILRRRHVPFGLLHCTSIYPTPYEKIRLGALRTLQEAFPDAVIGLSDHSVSIFPCLGAVAHGAAILERHFTADKRWSGPDIPISMDPDELRQLITGSRIIHQTLGGTKSILDEEAPTIRFAYASVVAVRDIEQGEILTRDNLWLKRPGTGELRAIDFAQCLGRRARSELKKNHQVRWDDLE